MSYLIYDSHRNGINCLSLDPNTTKKVLALIQTEYERNMSKKEPNVFRKLEREIAKNKKAKKKK